MKLTGDIPTLDELADLVDDIAEGSEEAPALNYVANLIRVHAQRDQP